MLGTGCVSRDEGKVDIRLLRAGELALGLLRGFLEALQGHAVLGQINALFLLELFRQPVDNSLVQVVTTQVRVAVRRLHLEDTIANVQDRHVKRAAAEIVDGDVLVLLLVETVSQRGRRRLVDDPQDIQAGDFPGVFRSLPLTVIEVRRHSDHGLGDLLTQIRLGIGSQLLQNHGRNFRR